ncbi:hypothetical protein QE152_g14081 [Popillia japonica]|uniref:Uncharacterized protein n=1 Tax=Popillia japonica TaxID=7064 RepID=A0AAW1LBV0_POPJA
MGISSSTGPYIGMYRWRFPECINESHGAAQERNQLSILQKTLNDTETPLLTFKENQEKELETQLQQWNALEYYRPNKILEWPNQSSISDKQELINELSAIKKEIYNLNREHSKLEVYNTRLKNNLEQITKDNWKLKEDNKLSEKICNKDISELKWQLEQVQQKMNNVEVENKKLQTSTQEWQTKCQRLMLDKQKLQGDITENTKEIDHLNRENSSLQTCTTQLKNELEQATTNHNKLKHEKNKKILELKHILKEMQQKINNTEVENRQLETYNVNMRDELGKVKESRSTLKKDIHRREQAITRYKSTAIRLEDELRQYFQNIEELKERLAKETVTDKTLRKIIQIYSRIEELQQVIATKKDIVVKTIKENDNDDKEKLIDKLKLDYDTCQAELASKNVIISNPNFMHIYETYKHFSHCNNNRKEATLRQVYQLEKSVKNFQDRYQDFSERLGKDVEEMEKFEKDLDTNSFAESFTVQEKLYQNVRDVGDEEITYRRKILQIDLKDVRATSTSTKSIVLFGIDTKSEDEDRSMISEFLEKNGIIYGIFTSRRLKKCKENKGGKPLVVEFSNEEIIEKVMELSKNKDWFLGSNPSVEVYTEVVH